MTVAASAALLVSALSAGAAYATPEGKTDLCHRPPGNPSNVKLVSVEPGSVADHLAHGDHHSFGGACYVVERQAVDFFAAERACKADFGGFLASIHSQAEDDFISSLVDPGGVGDITAAIGGIPGTTSGLFDSGPAFTYAWSDGSPWDFQNWRSSTSEPNRSGPPPAGVQFWPNTNGPLSGWNDVPQSADLGGYVCKYEPKR